MATFLKMAGGFVMICGVIILVFIIAVGRNDPLAQEAPPALAVILAGALISAF